MNPNIPSNHWLNALPRGDHIIVLDISWQRLARFALHTSPVWTWTVSDLEVSAAWGTLWRNAFDGASAQDINDVKSFGYTPGKKIDIRQPLRQALERALVLRGTNPLEGVLVIGTCALYPIVQSTLKQLLQTSISLEQRDSLALPDPVTVETLRAEISKFYPPQTQEGYTLAFAESHLDETNPKLLKAEFTLLEKGVPAPTNNAPNSKTLYRAIPSFGARPLPIHLIVRNHEGQLRHVLETHPVSNKFNLEWWIGYPSGKLNFRVTEQSKENPAVPLSVSVTPIAPAGTNNIETLPTLELKRAIDIVFIVDGTMRRKIETQVEDVKLVEWRPDMQNAKELINAIQENLKPLKADVHCGLYLYGDRLDIALSDYAFQEYSLEPLLDLQRRVMRGMKATSDLDYEAFLEMGLKWVNPASAKAGWRSAAEKWVVVIGYAPPHPYQANVFDPAFKYNYTKYEFTHEPFTSNIDWYAQLQEIRKAGVHMIGVWVKYSDLARAHPCMQYSSDVWFELGEDGRRYFENLTETFEPTMANQIVEQIQNESRVFYTPSSSLTLPLLRQEQRLRNL
jgi:hypothetical protein